MYRVTMVAAVCAIGVLLAGCQSTNRATMRSTGWGTGAWGYYQELSGKNTAEIKAAAETLHNSNDICAKVKAANFFACQRVSTNLIAEACEAGMRENQPMDVRLACARALSMIGSSTAIRHLRVAEDKSRVPVYRDYSALDKYGPLPCNTCPTTLPAARETFTCPKCSAPVESKSTSCDKCGTFIAEPAPLPKKSACNTCGN